VLGHLDQGFELSSTRQRQHPILVGSASPRGHSISNHSST
jgi:hypothetical protein